MTTYKEIIEWIKHNYGFTVKTCWIADVKEICGLNVKVAKNRIDMNCRQNPCPEDKVEIIKKAFINFGDMKE